MFIVEDELHAEPLTGEFASREDAVADLRRLAELPWNAAPNRAPCTNWRNCGRRYDIVEYDASAEPWRELSRPSIKRSPQRMAVIVSLLAFRFLRSSLFEDRYTRCLV